MAKPLPARRPRPLRQRRRLAPEKRKQQLLEAVEAVVDEVGYQGTTVPRVVAHAGVAQGSFYRYFRDVDAAVLELMRRVVTPIEEAAARLDFSRVQSPADLEWELLRFYRIVAHELVAHPRVIREALLVAPAARGELGAAMSSFLESMRQAAFRLVEGHMGRDPFRTAVDLRALAGAVIGMILGAAQAAVEIGKDFDPEAWATEMARFEAGALVDPRCVVARGHHP